MSVLSFGDLALPHPTYQDRPLLGEQRLGGASSKCMPGKRLMKEGNTWSQERGRPPAGHGKRWLCEAAHRARRGHGCWGSVEQHNPDSKPRGGDVGGQLGMPHLCPPPTLPPEAPEYSTQL